MATIKSFTSLEQSKKLAKILPLESADHFHIIGRLHTDGPRYEVIRPRNEVVETDKYWPCWSLAALIDAIPKRIGDYNIFRMDINDIDTSMWYDEIGYGVNNDLPNITMKSAVDACAEIIIKLSELKML